MAKQSWEIPDPPEFGDETQEITFQAVGQALSNWEWFEGNLSLGFSTLIGVGFGSVAALRAYGSVETFRGRSTMIARAAEVYFKQNNNAKLENDLRDILTLAEKLASRRNDIAHGIVQPLLAIENLNNVHKGFVLYPAFYATRKRRLIEGHQLNDNSTHFTIEPTYTYSSVEINRFAKQFGELANRTIDVITFLVRREQSRMRESMQR